MTFFSRTPHRWERLVAALTSLIVATSLLAACESQTVGATVPLEQAIAQLSPADETPGPTLIVGVAVALSPVEVVERYGPFVSWLGEALGLPTELVQRRSLADVVDLASAGRVDLAILDVGAYLAYADSGRLNLVGAPAWGDGATPHAVLVTGPSAAGRSLTELKGAVFAASDPLSLSGSLYPTSLLLDLGEDPDAFFDGEIHPVGQDRAIQAVAKGLADVTAVDDWVLRSALQRDPSLLGRLTVIEVSGPYPGPAIVVGTSASGALADDIATLVLGAVDDPGAAAALRAMGVLGFVPATDELFDRARDLTPMGGGST